MLLGVTTYHDLFDEHGEEDEIADFSDSLEHICCEFRVSEYTLQLCVVELKHACRVSIVIFVVIVMPFSLNMRIDDHSL